MKANYKNIQLLRLLTYIGLLLSVSGLWLTGCSMRKVKEVSVFKNVVVIIGDDHANTVLGVYGNDLADTPNLDRLAMNGAMFKNAYANSPLCSASRQAILTGKYPHATGVNLLFTPFNDKTNTTIAEHLRNKGFVTASVGKQHFNTWIWDDLYKNGPPDFGFDTIIDKEEYEGWLEKQSPAPLPDTISFYGDKTDLPLHIAKMNPLTLPHPVRDEHAKGTFLARTAIDFLENNKNRDFLLWVNFNEPHAPFAFPIEYAGSYKALEMPLPEGSPEDDRWVPERFKGFTDEQKKGMIASYYTSVKYMDKNVGLVINALKEKGLYDETLIIYLGDHGYLLHDHKRFEKHTLWQEAIQAPLILAGGDDQYSGKVIETPVEFTDLVPFITDALQIESLPEAQGISFEPLLEKETTTHKDYVFAEFLEDNKAMVADRDWKYIFSTGKRDLGQGYATGQGAFGIYHRLYDLKNDPKETTNLAYDKKFTDKVRDMKEAVLEIFKKTHPYADELPHDFTIDGQLVWFCEPRDVGADYGGEPHRIFYPGEKTIENVIK